MIHNGGVIPKQLYINESIDEPDGNLDEVDGDDVTSTTKIKLNEVNLYQNVKLRPGQFYEIVIKNDDHRAVLTWDYESVKTEVLFTIFETTDDISMSNGESDHESLISVINQNLIHRRRLQLNLRRCWLEGACQL